MKKVVIYEISQYGKYKLGLTEEEAKEYLKERIWNKFEYWAKNKTCPLLKTEKETIGKGYYRHDVKRFADAILGD